MRIVKREIGIRNSHQRINLRNYHIAHPKPGLSKVIFVVGHFLSEIPWQNRIILQNSKKWSRKSVDWRNSKIVAKFNNLHMLRGPLLNRLRQL